MSVIPDDGTILEIGCGTGQATLPFAERGYNMVCLDIGADLIEIARQKLARFPGVSLVNEAFEGWNNKGEQFDLVMVATSFWWVDQDIAYQKIASILKPAGRLAVFFNRYVKRNEGFFIEVQAVYQELAPSMINKPTISVEYGGNIEESGLFLITLKKAYPWTAQYTADEYIKLLSTYSDHINLHHKEQKALFDGIRDLIETNYKGEVIKHHDAVLEMAGLNA